MAAGTVRLDTSDASPASAELLQRLGDVLRQAGFDGPRTDVLRAMPAGVPPASVLDALDRPADSRLALLLSLFADDRVAPRASAAGALSPIALECLLDAGLLECEGSGVRRGVSLYPAGGLIVAGDPLRRHGTPGYVASMSPATRTVARLAVVKAGGTALDIGTGSGALALRAASSARQVVGVDINPRALHYARVNEHLNAMHNVAWVQGDWFEPVRGQKFDLVLANPPCAISPDSLYVYRDGSEAAGADELSRTTVRQAAEHLHEGGFATVLCNWIHAASDWQQPLLAWLQDLGCDALLLRTSSQDPLQYAMSWIEAILYPDPAEADAAIDRWVRHLTMLGVERLGWGAVILRRRSGATNWTRGFDLDHGGPSGDGQDQLERIFAGCDFLETRAQRLSACRWRLVDGHQLDQALLSEAGSYAARAAKMRHEPGLNLPARIDTRAVELLSGCDGRRPLGELLLACPVPDGLDEGAFHAVCIDAVKELIATGFLVGEDPGRRDGS